MAIGISKPNLVYKYCSEIKMLAHLTVDKGVIKKIRELMKEKAHKETDIAAAISGYILAKKKHMCLIFISSFTKAKKNRICFDFSLYVRPEPFPFKYKAKEVPDAFKLLNLLKKESIKGNFHIHTNFVYPSKKLTSLVSLPYDAQIREFGKVEIAGLRIEVKGKPGEYSQIIDTYNKKIIVHSIIYDETGIVISDNFLKNILKKSVAYSRRLLKEKAK
ncbi:MAG: hypothetical protein WBD28_00080 [Candidatus Zixiibacteriota bacterium]